jgi:tetratricopeptide (TPR) repeat protein
MSRALSGLRQRDHAVEEAGRAVQILKEIPPGHPGLASGRFNRELALAEADLAEALDETNDLFQGLVHHRMADRLMEDALSADSPDFRWHGEAANIRGALSAALLNSDNKEEGAKVAENALARTTALVSRDPENMPWRRAHAVALEWMGEIRSKEKDYAGAASCLEKAVEQIRIVSGEDPTIEVVQWDLASILLQAGYLRSDQQEAAGAEPFFYEALNVMIPFTLNDDIPVPGRIYGLAAAISNLGDCLKDQRQDQAASALYVEWETRALTLVPAHPLWRFLAADSEWNRAQLTWNSGDKSAALALFGKSLKQLSQLHGELPAEDAPSAGWAWRERFGKRANPVIQAALQEGPPLSAEGRNLATEALRVLFEEWKVDPFPDADKVIKSELEKMLAP